jgi:hypothetical protein
MPNLTHLSLRSLDDYAGPRELLTFVKENVKEPVLSVLLELLESKQEIITFAKYDTHVPLIQFNSRKMRWQQVYAYMLAAACGLSYREIAEWEETTKVSARKRAWKVRDAIIFTIVGYTGRTGRGLAYQKLQDEGWTATKASHVLLVNTDRLRRYYKQTMRRRDKEIAKKALLGQV